jgi:hypothetical protein
MGRGMRWEEFQKKEWRKLSMEMERKIKEKKAI